MTISIVNKLNLDILDIHNKDKNLGSRIDGESKFRFLAILNRQPFHEEGRESRSSTSTKRMEHQESLQARTVVSHPRKINQIHM